MKVMNRIGRKRNCGSRPSIFVGHVEGGIRHFSRKVLDPVDYISLKRQLIITIFFLSSFLFLSFFFYTFCSFLYSVLFLLLYIYLSFFSSFSVPFVNCKSTCSFPLSLLFYKLFSISFHASNLNLKIRLYRFANLA